MIRAHAILLSTVALLLLTGSDGCPLTLSTGATTPSTSRSDASGGHASTNLDVGGASGAYWKVTCEDEIRLLLHDGTKVYSQSTQSSSGVVALGGALIDLSSVCGLTDAVCPQKVFPASTAIVQPSTGDLSIVIMGFNRVGPFAAWKAVVGLKSSLDGATLTVPLATATTSSASTSSDLCATQVGSSFVATASATSVSSTGLKADTLTGDVTLIYSGSCLAVLGSSSLDSSARLEITARCSARRSQ